ncbi:MAG TPA: hypothetical protein VNA12_04470 [Mycobacteriales bacterium]|nr:hypothetical protein [Mycobacteriales bacterium]
MRRVALALALVLAAAAGSPAVASHKEPLYEAYEVTAPVPYAVDGASHCTDGVEGLTKNTRPLTLPDRGLLEIELSGYLADWVLELFDAKGKMLGQAAQFAPANTSPKVSMTYKKATPGQKVRIVACNVKGGPKAKVAYTFTFR